eukprot:gene11346-13228_t
MKKYIVLLMLLFAVSTLTKAQPKPPTAQEITAKIMEEYDKRLKLNSTQRGVIYNYTYDLAKEQTDLVKRRQAGTFKEEDISKFDRFQNETNANIRKILKGEQLAEFEKILDDRMNGGNDKKKKKKRGKEEEAAVTGIEGLKLQP